MTEPNKPNSRTRTRSASTASQVHGHQANNTPKLVPMTSFKLKEVNEGGTDPWVTKMTPMETLLEKVREEEKGGP